MPEAETPLSHPRRARARSDSPRAVMSGRKFASGELELMLLALLDRRPAHGYELIGVLAALSQDGYVPSPGVIYPALARLQADGHARSDAQGVRKQYHLTDAGRTALATRREQAEALFHTLRHFALKMQALNRGLDEAQQDGANGAAAGWLPAFVQARIAFKHALLVRTGADTAQQQRMADILLAATAAMEAQVPPSAAVPLALWPPTDPTGSKPV